MKQSLDEMRRKKENEFEKALGEKEEKTPK